MNQRSKLITFVKLMAVGYGITAVLLLGITFLLYRFQLGEGQIHLLVTAVYVLICGVGGFLSGKVWKRKRLLLGLLYGGVFFGILFLLSLFAGGLYQSPLNALKVCLLCLAGGAVGGVLS